MNIRSHKTHYATHVISWRIQIFPKFYLPIIRFKFFLCIFFSNICLKIFEIENHVFYEIIAVAANTIFPCNQPRSQIDAVQCNFLPTYCMFHWIHPCSQPARQSVSQSIGSSFEQTICQSPSLRFNASNRGNDFRSLISFNRLLASDKYTTDLKHRNKIKWKHNE